MVHENLHYLVATLLHVGQLALAYGLMLVVMTYNVGLTIAVLAGAGVGYFLFARLRQGLLVNQAGCH
jgi:copper transporter 1